MGGAPGGGGPSTHAGQHGDPFGPPPPPASANPAFGAPSPPPPPGRPVPHRKGRGGLIALVGATALLAGALGGGIGFVAADRSDSGSGSTTVSSSADPAALNRKPGSVAAIANTALKSVVTIKAEGNRQSGTGTGFVYDKEGHIVTNNHVVAPAATGGKLSVTFSNGKSYDASIVGRAEG